LPFLFAILFVGVLLEDLKSQNIPKSHSAKRVGNPVPIFIFLTIKDTIHPRNLRRDIYYSKLITILILYRANLSQNWIALIKTKPIFAIADLEIAVEKLPE